jgi:rare lipoprotein A (peptidoglycan hydrolase)
VLLLLAACAHAPRRPSPAPAPGAVPPPTVLPQNAPDVGQIPDAVPRDEPRSAFGNPPFYIVAGHRYVVLHSAAGYVERGVASWYGTEFHGLRTSTGEPYDMFAMTAAHKTLPLPCYARVTNLANGRHVVVRINDRGPFVANRIIDLSYSAAARLDMIHNGTAFVQVEVLTAAAPTLTASMPVSTQAVQAAGESRARKPAARARRRCEHDACYPDSPSRHCRSGRRSRSSPDTGADRQLLYPGRRLRESGQRRQRAAQAARRGPAERIHARSGCASAAAARARGSDRECAAVRRPDRASERARISQRQARTRLK